MPTMTGRYCVRIGRFVPGMVPKFRAASYPDAPLHIDPLSAELDELVRQEGNGHA